MRRSRCSVLRPTLTASPPSSSEGRRAFDSACRPSGKAGVEKRSVWGAQYVRHRREKKAVQEKEIKTNLTWPQVSPRPCHGPTPRLRPLHKLCDGPVVHANLPEPFDDGRDAAVFAEHARVPLDLLLQLDALCDHPVHKGHLAAGRDHLDLCAGAGLSRKHTCFS